MMLKHVLVPLDGSELAERALDYIRLLVDPDEGRVTLLTALDVPEYSVLAYYPAVVPYESDAEKAAQSAIPKAQDYLKHSADGLRAVGYHVDIEAVIGEPANAIVEKADELGVEAIIMSTHGRSGISRWIFGSVAGKVLSSAPCPVFVIPMRHKTN